MDSDQPREHLSAKGEMSIKPLPPPTHTSP